MLTIFDPARYAAVNARIRAGVANLVPPAVWTALLGATDLSDLVYWLDGTAYRDVLAQHTEEALDLQRIERALWQYLVQTYRTPLLFLHGSPGALVDWLWRRFEIDNLKTVLRTVERDVPSARIRASLIPLGPASDLPWNNLADARSVSAAVDRLGGTWYGRVLDEALERYRREGLLFVLEVALDLAYYRRLLRLLDDLSGRDRKEAGRFVGTMVESQNLLWAYRYRIYFQLSPEEILNYTLHRRLQVDAAVVREIATGAPLADVITAVWGMRLPDVERFADVPEDEALPELEIAFWRYRHDLARAALRGYPLHLGVVLAYLVLLESEVRDLIVLVEGKAAGWSPERIEPYFIAMRG